MISTPILTPGYKSYIASSSPGDAIQAPGFDTGSNMNRILPINQFGHILSRISGPFTDKSVQDVIIQDMKELGALVEQENLVSDYVGRHTGSSEYISKVIVALNDHFPEGVKIIRIDPDPDYQGDSIQILIRLQEYPDAFYDSLDQVLNQIYKEYPVGSRIFVSSDFAKA